VRVDRTAPGVDSGIVGVARRVVPAVVSIDVAEAPQQVASGPGGRQQLPPGFPPGLLPPGHPGVPGGQNPFGGPQRRAPRRGSGSGFIVTSTGEILTNNHVVEDAEEINVTLNDRRVFRARVIGRDPNTDVALIKIDATGLPTLALGDDDAVQVGQPVFAVGNPLGLNFTVTTGIISAKNRGGDLARLFESNIAVADFLQTDAVINPGNSGGPLLDLAGRVIGINSAIESPTGVYAGYGFAVPVSIARIAMDQFRKFGRVRRAVLGVSIQDVTADDARATGLGEIRGALVGGFGGAEQSPAQRAGVQEGDVILAVNGTPVSSVATLQRTVYELTPGQQVTLDLHRYGERRQVRFALAEVPDEPRVASAAPRAATPASPGSKLGVSVVALSAETARQAGVRVPPSLRGVLVGEVDPSGPSLGRLGRGDVIVAVLGAGGRRTAVSSPEQLRDLVAQAPNGVVSLLVASGGQGQTRVANVAVR
jgi:serine protease Do